MQKIKKGDNVQILSGKDAGKRAPIDKVWAKEGKVLIASANIFKRHVRKMQGVEGGIIDLPRPIQISNVALVCPNCKKQTRVGFEMIAGEKQRICRKCKKKI